MNSKLLTQILVHFVSLKAGWILSLHFTCVCARNAICIASEEINFTHLLVFTCHMTGMPNIWMKLCILFVSHIAIRLHLSLENMNKDSECVRTSCWRDTQTEKIRKNYWREKITQYGISSGLEKIMPYGVLIFIISTIPVKIIKLRTLKSVQIHAVHTLTNSYVPGHSL